MTPWVLPLAGAILGGIGSFQQTQADVGLLEGQADAADFNAIMTRLMGRQELQSSTATQLMQRRAAGHVLASQRAAIAQAGIGTGGSAADVVAQSETAAELDRLNIAYEGKVRFLTALKQADLEESNAFSLRQSARRTERAGAISGIGSLLTGAAKIPAVAKLFG